LTFARAWKSEQRIRDWVRTSSGSGGRTVRPYRAHCAQMHKCTHKMSILRTSLHQASQSVVAGPPHAPDPRQNRIPLPERGWTSCWSGSFNFWLAFWPGSSSSLSLRSANITNNMRKAQKGQDNRGPKELARTSGLQINYFNQCVCRRAIDRMPKVVRHPIG